MSRRNRRWIDRQPKDALPGYRFASAAEKRTMALDRYRAPAMRCARCLSMVLPDQLEAHLRERCAGSREARDAEVKP